MSPKVTHADGFTTIEQVPFTVPQLTIKDLLSVIPAHCFKRSALRSSVYIVWDCFIIGVFYKVTVFADTFITPSHIALPHPALYLAARVSLWALYSFWAGLFATGLWVIGHECGHQAFSESKTINDTVGWIVHSALGVPYQAWRITHAKHHASTGHLTQDQVFVPKTRSQFNLPPLDPSKENIYGSSVADSVSEELWEALGDSPIGAALGSASYLLGGWPAYIIMNASGQLRYASGTNHFSPSAPMFNPRQYTGIIVSNIGVALWLTAVLASIYHFGFLTVFKVYLAPYLWVNHWLVLITFLQHTDPLLPHWRDGQDGFNFVRGALATLDRNLLGDCGSIMGWIGAHATHGISETHVLHHVSSKIPHYHAWTAAKELRKVVEDAGLKLDGRPGGWSEVYRVFKECKFVEDEGNVVFYKNAHGLAASRVVSSAGSPHDSGVELNEKSD